MNILMIAPQPFFQPRGTPISVLQRLHGLSALGFQVDLVTYHIGEDVTIPGVTIIRSPRVPFIHQVKIGPSLAKIPLDIVLFFQVLWLLLRRRYDAVHSHEEGAYLAMGLCWLFNIPHLYDMHSSLPRQLMNFNFGNYRPIVWLMERIERWVLHTCAVTLTVGSDLEVYALQVNQRLNHLRIENIPVHYERDCQPETAVALRQQFGLENKLVIVYTGTFEGYQGFDLLFASAQLVVAQAPDVVFIMVGGQPEQVRHWQKEADRLGLGEHMLFSGLVPLEESLRYLALADILISPRTGGLSVPLKIYSYLHAGKPTVATNIFAHTQVLNETTAVLTDPTPTAYAAGLLRLIHDPVLRQTLGQNARTCAEKEYSRESYLQKLEQAYLSIKYQTRISEIDQLAGRICAASSATP